MTMTAIRKGKFYDIYRIEVNAEHEGMPLGQFITERFPELKEVDLSDHIKRNKILVNSKACKFSQKIKQGDTITALTDKPHRTALVQPQDIPLDIIFEDEHLVVVNKPAGMVVHPGPSNWSGTLANALVARYPNLPRQPKGQDKPGIVHRIDKETSGLMVCVKDKKTMDGLTQQFFTHSVDRTYYAIIWGHPKYKFGTIQGDIKRDVHDKRLRNVVPEDTGGKYAITHFKVLKKFKHLALVQCNLETGRTHQIRVHLNHIGHPLFADRLYGKREVIYGKEDKSFLKVAQELLDIMPRQGLHAKSLGFIHPITKEKLSFESEFPQDFATVLAKLETIL